MSTSTPVVEEKRKFSLFPHPHHHRNESEAYAAFAVRQPVVEQEQEREAITVTGASAVPTPSTGGSPSKVTGSLSKRWLLGSPKGFFSPPPAVYTAKLAHSAA